MKVDWQKLCDLATAEVETTLAELPPPLRERAAKLPVTLEPVPNAGLQADGIAPDVLGLFTGAEMAEEDALPMPPQIIMNSATSSGWTKMICSIAGWNSRFKKI